MSAAQRRRFYWEAHRTGRHARQAHKRCPVCKRVRASLLKNRCLNKVAYRTFDEAEQARLAAVAAGVTDDGRGDGECYTCDLCDWWHWGRPRPGRRALDPAALVLCRAVVLPLRRMPGEVPKALQETRPPFHPTFVDLRKFGRADTDGNPPHPPAEDSPS